LRICITNVKRRRSSLWYRYANAFDWLMNIRETTGRLARWALYLQSYTFEIIHRKGRAHSNVDTLSRPVLISSLYGDTEGTETNVEDISTKFLDPWEDEALIFYLQKGRHQSGLSKNALKRVLKKAKHYLFYEDNLWYRPDPEHICKDKLVPRTEDRHELINRAHLVGHFGKDTTYARLKELYYWKKMYAMVEDVVKRCRTCIRHKKERVVEHEAVAFPIEAVFDRVGIDCIFGLPESEEGYKGILVITEYLTKYPYAVPIYSKTATEIAQHFFTYISLFGPPKELLSDQGTVFLNSIMKELVRVAGIEHRVTSPYHPRTNGLTERFNGTLVTALKKHAENDPKGWPDWLPYILMAYRTRIYLTTNMTPFQLMFGRPMNNFENFKMESRKITCEDRATELRRLFEETQDDVIQRIKSKQEIQKEQQNKRMKISDHLNVGTKVTIKALKIQSKFLPNYSGIFKIAGLTKLKNYWLKNEEGVMLNQAFPRSRLKVVETGNEPEGDVQVEEITEIDVVVLNI